MVSCPQFRISFQKGFRSSIMLEETLRDLFRNYIYIARSNYLYRWFISRSFGGCWQRPWVSKLPPPALPPLPCLVTYGNRASQALSWVHWTRALLVPAKTPNRQATMGPPRQGGLGKGWQAPMRRWLPATWYLSLCWYLVPTSVSYKHQQFHTFTHSNASFQKGKWKSTRID